MASTLGIGLSSNTLESRAETKKRLEKYSKKVGAKHDNEAGQIPLAKRVRFALFSHGVSLGLRLVFLCFGFMG